MKRGTIFPMPQRVLAKRITPAGVTFIAIEQGQAVRVASVVHEKMPACGVCGKWHTSYITVALVADPTVRALLERCQL